MADWVFIPRLVLEECYRTCCSPQMHEMLKGESFIYEAQLVLDVDVCLIRISARVPRLTRPDYVFDFAPEMVKPVVRILAEQGYVSFMMSSFRQRLDDVIRKSTERLQWPLT